MINYNPKLWGKHQWFMLEVIARSLPEYLDQNLQNQLKLHLQTLSFLLPCETCQEHMKEYNYIKNINNANFTTREHVKQWINDFHNQQLPLKGKRTMLSVDKYYENYFLQDKTTNKDIIIIFILILILVFLITKLK